MSVPLRQRKLPSGKTQLYLAVNIHGHRTYQALNFYLSEDKARNKETLRLAEAIRAKRELEVHADAEGLPDSNRRKQDFFAFAEQIYDDKLPLTKRTYTNAMEHLSEFAGKDLTVGRITAKFCEQFLAYLNKNLHPNSAAAYYARFKTVIRALVKANILPQDPAAGIHVRRVESLPKYLTLKEVHDLLKQPCGNNEVRDAFLFSCNTGLRYQDIKSLTWGQFRRQSIEFIQSKTGIAQQVLMSTSAINLLERRRGFRGEKKGQTDNREELIFSLPRRSTIDKVLKTWGERAKLQVPLSFHKARHTFATLALESGVDIYTTSKLLGHKNLSTTQIYARVTDTKKKAAVAKLPEIM
jgi:integrase